MFANFEMVIEWHLRSGGGQLWGLCVGAGSSVKDLKPGVLPQYGIEVQALDRLYRAMRSAPGKRVIGLPHGDVFPDKSDESLLPNVS